MLQSKNDSISRCRLSQRYFTSTAGETNLISCVGVEHKHQTARITVHIQVAQEDAVYAKTSETIKNSDTKAWNINEDDTYTTLQCRVQIAYN